MAEERAGELSLQFPRGSRDPALEQDRSVQKHQ